MQYETRTLKVDHQAVLGGSGKGKLNALLRDGWEIVSEHTPGALNWGHKTSYVLRRPLEDQSTPRRNPGFVRSVAAAMAEPDVSNAAPPETVSSLADRDAQILHLADMHRRGLLSDDEFTEAKAKVSSGS